MGVVHALSAILPAMRPQAVPAEVYATSCSQGSMGYDIPPAWNIHLRFDNDAAGFCFGNIDRGNGYDAYHNIYGTKGGFVFDSLLERPRQVRYWSDEATGGRWVWPLDRARCRREEVEELAWPDDCSTPASGNVVEHQTAACVDHFIQCVRRGEPSPLSFEGSAPIAEVGWAALMSAELGHPIPLPLDHDEAERFFGRETSDAH
jgi:predicted dehydrogenase